MVLGACLVAAEVEAEPRTGGATGALAAGFRKGRETGFPVPRFVSLKAARAHMRVGPSTDYATRWVYSARGLPLEITEEYGNWRRVRDPDGATGWMFSALLSGNRTAIVGPWLKEPIPLHAGRSHDTRIIARLSPRVGLNVSACDGTWCEVSLQKGSAAGYVDQASLWGVYPGETLK